MAETSYVAGKIDLLDFVIINYSRKFVTDIRRQCVEFNVYEDLFSPTISFTATMLDSNGLIERFPFIGEELVAVSFKLPTQTTIYKKIFSVYKIGNRNERKERDESFSIFGISLESIIDCSSTVDSSFIGQTFSDIISKTYDQYFLNSDLRHGLRNEDFYLTYDKPLFSEPSSGLHSVVAPLTTPFKFISYCARQAQSIKYKESDYVFYENNDGFNFQTISSLIEQEPIEDYYLADPATKETSDSPVTIKDYQIVRKLEYNSDEFDTIKSTLSGLYDNSVLVLDPILKKFTTQTFNYYNSKNWDDDFTNLDKHSFVSEYSHYQGYKGDSHSRYIISNLSDIEYNQTSYLKGRTIDRNGNILDPVSHFPFRRHKFLNNLISKTSQLNTKFILKIDIPGAPERKVGDIIRLFVPQRSAVKEFNQVYNLLYGSNPKFLISSVHHRYDFTQDLYITTLELIKDSPGQQIVQTEGQLQSEKSGGVIT